MKTSTTKSAILRTIDEIEDFIDSCQGQPFSNGKRIIVDKDTIDELLTKLRADVPGEVDKYMKIISNKDEILRQADSDADATRKAAMIERQALVAESAVMEQAREDSARLLADTQAKAQSIINDATRYGDEYKHSAVVYADGLLQGMQDYTAAAMNSMQQRFEQFYNQLNSSYQVIASNREELKRQAQSIDGTEEA